MLEKVERLAYRLDVSFNWRIHSVFSVAQLEPPPPSSQELLERPHLDHPPSVFVKKIRTSHNLLRWSGSLIVALLKRAEEQ